MSFPNCKLELFNTGGSLTHTITDDILECQTKDILTSGVGTFSFALPAQKGSDYVYRDIGNNFKAKVYLGYNGSYTHVFSGKILPFTSNIGSQAVRVFEGKSLGEILERRLKINRRYENLPASTIVSVDIAAELGIYNAAKVQGDDTPVTVTIRTESYFDYLRKVSDYWHSAGPPLLTVKKDFFVDKDGDLVWWSRPLRTSGVESLVYGENILGYSLKYDILGIKNKITVYGAPSAYFPNDRDVFTDALSGTYEGKAWRWNEINGTLYRNAGNAQYGKYCIHCQNDASNNSCTFELDLPHAINLRDINQLSFLHQVGTTGGTWFTSLKIRLLAPDNVNYFELKDSLDITNLQWFGEKLSLGDGAIYDEVENLNGIWKKEVNANWWNIRKVKFIAPYTGGSPVYTANLHIDKLYFSPDRWVDFAQSTTSQNVYGLREAEFTDENLLSKAECQKRAETLLYQLKDRTLHLDFTVPGNTNILIGDRLILTLPPDNISALPFDVVSVEQHFVKEPQGFQTRVQCVDSVNTRTLPPLTPLDSIQRQILNTKEVVSEIYSRVVR